MGKLDDALAAALAEGRCRVGQVLMVACEGGGFELCHRRDAGRPGLETFRSESDARTIATYDDAGNFRPLKSAPNLRRGWRLVLPDLAALRQALEYLYPASLGTWLAWQEGSLPATSLRQTVLRQTGMYRVTGKISTVQADELAEVQCNSLGGCLRTILWRIEDGGAVPGSLPHEKFAIEYDQTGDGERVIPLLCAEPCHLFVAAARDRVKGANASG